MAGLLFVLLLVIPIAELWAIVQVAQEIGVVQTLGLLIAISVLGAWLLKQQGMATWRRLQMTMQRGEIPTEEVTDGALIVLGGALLLTPGFLTDAVGLILLFPPTRSTVKSVARRAFGRMAVARGARTARQIYDVKVVRSDRRPQGSNPPGGRLPSEELPQRGVDSPDKG